MSGSLSEAVLSLYEVEGHKFLEDVNSDSWLLRHKKTGARVALLPTEDDNKVFYIAFRTTPDDSTGVAHIIEHSVLCGSRDFPVKDPFIELAKGSLNTFLNAMTYPDKTVYPIASCNDADFKNLMHVYLDAVFYPNIYKEENIFKQEGWHYEAESADSPITVNGVVYNEMKGALSSPDDVLARSVYSSLYPHTTYANESGGDPLNIPDLTYEKFLEFHGKYYHPSNSYIYLYGNMDMEERLLYLDKEYLSSFDYLKVDSEVQVEPAFADTVEIESSYSILEEDDEKGKSYLAYNLALAPDGLDADLNTAFKVLDYVLGDAEGAPVKKALRDAGIGEDVYTMLELGIRQPCYSIIAKNTDPEKKAQFLQIIEETLRKLVRDGIDQRALLAGINYFEFRYREANFGSYPKGLVYGLGALDTWLYDDTKPFIGLQLGSVYADLRQKAKEGYFEELIQKYLLDNTHCTVLTMTPEKGLTEKKADDLRVKLRAYADSLTSEKRQEIVDQLAALRKWQETPNTPEEYETIPMLSREDMRKEATAFVNVESSTNDVKILTHPLFTGGIHYLTFMYDISDLPQKYLPYLSIFKTLLGVLDTQNYDYADFDREVNIMTGGIGASITSYTDTKNPQEYKLIFEVSAKTLRANTKEAFRLVKEMILGTKWKDFDRMREVLEEDRAGMQMDLQGSGHTTAAVRALSYLSETSAIMDMLNGIEGYKILKETCKNIQKEEEPEKLAGILKEMTKFIFRRDNLMVDCTGDRDSFEEVIVLSKEFAQSMYGREDIAEDAGAPFTIDLAKKNEGFTTAGEVQYVCRAGNYSKKGLAYTGVLRVLRVIMGYDYLWNRIRVKGGAYGCMSSFSREGSSFLVSYRDPHLKQTVKTFEEAADYIRSFDADERTMTKYIIGAVSAMDHPLTPPAYGKYSLASYMTGYTYEDAQRERDEVLQAQSEDIRKLADYLEAIMDEDCICAVGSDEKIKAGAGLFASVEKLA